jgi:hypothetical protein
LGGEIPRRFNASITPLCNPRAKQAGALGVPHSAVNIRHWATVARLHRRRRRESAKLARGGGPTAQNCPIPSGDELKRVRWVRWIWHADCNSCDQANARDDTAERRVEVNPTLSRNLDLPTLGEWLTPSARRATSRAADSRTGDDATSVSLASLLKGIVGGLVYAIVSLAVAGSAIFLALALLPMLVIGSAALAGLVVTIAGYVLAVFGLIG